MNLTITKTRIRPSITIGPNIKHVTEEERFKCTRTHSRIIEQKVRSLIRDEIREYALDYSWFETGVVPKPDYDKAIYNQGCRFLRCAFVCAYVNDEYNKALYWYRKCWACFEHSGVWLIRERCKWKEDTTDYLWLYTDILKDSDWGIAATVKVTSFLGTDETSTQIGTIEEEPDLTSTKVLLKQFEQYVKEQHVKRTDFFAR